MQSVRCSKAYTLICTHVPYTAKPKKGVQKKEVLGFDMKYKEDRAKSGDF